MSSCFVYGDFGRFLIAIDMDLLVIPSMSFGHDFFLADGRTHHPTIILLPTFAENRFQAADDVMFEDGRPNLHLTGDEPRVGKTRREQYVTIMTSIGRTGVGIAATHP